jgi:hypothetical protein
VFPHPESTKAHLPEVEVKDVEGFAVSLVKKQTGSLSKRMRRLHS